MLDTPFPPWPSFTDDEIAAVEKVLRSNRVNAWTGQETRQFEKEFASWAGVDHAVALANGTVALDVALRAMNIGPGDDVIVTPRSFIASVSCVVTAGAQPVFADVDKNSQNITAETIASALTPATKAVIVVHLAGLACDMDPILDLARKHNLLVLEDCAQAHGARYKGRSVGSMGDVGAWSFCQDKIMSTGGEGGMVTTSNADLWSRMWSYKDHGKSFEAMFGRSHPPGFRWVHESFGTNWRMLEVQAAIGLRQLARMETWTAARLRNASRIWAAARNLPALRVPAVPEWAGHGCYKAYVFVEPDRLGPGWSRDRIVQELVARGVPCLQGSCSEIYLEKAFDGSGFRPADRLPVARELGETSLMFLVHPTLDDRHIDDTIAALASVMLEAANA